MFIDIALHDVCIGAVDWTHNASIDWSVLGKTLTEVREHNEKTVMKEVYRDSTDKAGCGMFAV